MKKALFSMLSAGIALSAAKWAYDNVIVVRYQMWIDYVWGSGYLDACESIRTGSINSPKYAYLGENGERVVVSAERLKELEELEVTHQEMEADSEYAEKQYEKWKIQNSALIG